MTNTNLVPIFVMGTVPDRCYANAQELLEEFASKLSVSADTITIIKGAKGETGDPGKKGDKGDQGNDGPGPVNDQTRYDLAIGSTYIDIDYFPEWQRATYNVYLDSMIGGSPDFNPGASGIVGVGSIIRIYANPVQKIRVFFLFGGGITAIPAANHVLSVNIVK